MKNEQIFTSRLMEQTTRTVTLDSGLTVQMCPMPGYAAAYTMITVGVGSIDIGYRLNGRNYPLPAGVAHYLEHKMFDCPYGDAMERFTALGVNANAFTSFDKTAYYFSGTEHFCEALEVLLDMVATPFFCPDSVKRERGIITEEIRMFQDSPDWMVLGNLMQVLYHRHPVREDIAGTEESIARIDSRLLRRCYDRFYHPGNMVLSVAGNFCEEDVLKLAERFFPSAARQGCMPLISDEPAGPLRRFTEARMPVATPLFEIGFKAPGGDAANMENRILDELLLDLIGGETTALYGSLYRSGHINSTFGSEVMAGRDFTCGLFDGESREPGAVYDALCGNIERLLKEGIPEEDFRRCQKANYGRYIGMYSRSDSVAGLMASAHFAGMHDIYYPLDTIRLATPEVLYARLKEDFDPANSALSVIYPLEKTT